jgi:prepilin-type N-terminal cleavage/methylation domain-containing protein
MRKNSGYTLIEVLISIAIIASTILFAAQVADLGNSEVNDFQRVQSLALNRQELMNIAYDKQKLEQILRHPDNYQDADPTLGTRSLFDNSILPTDPGCAATERQINFYNFSVHDLQQDETATPDSQGQILLKFGMHRFQDF